MSGVLCTGNLAVDTLARPVDRLQWGATTMVESIEQHLGGNGSNTSYTLGKLGARVRMLGMVGTDGFADYVLGRLGGAGVDTGAIRRSAAPTAATMVLVDSRGDRLFLHRMGASEHLDFTAEEFAREFAAGFSHYHMATPFALPRLRPRMPEILRQARAAGLTTSIDTHWDYAGRWMEDIRPCLPYTDILFANEDESRMLTGATEPAQSAAILRDSGARVAVLKLSRRGCAVFGEGMAFEYPAFEVPVVDTTGAGDCFVAGFLAARDRGLGYAEAARFANAVGALSIQKLGSVEGVRNWEETEAWMAYSRSSSPPFEYSRIK